MSFFGSIYADPDLPHRARTVYMYLRDRAGGGSCWPGVKTIARDLHLSPRTVQRALNDLEHAGYIQRQRRQRENGSCTSNLISVISVRTKPILMKYLIRCVNSTSSRPISRQYTICLTVIQNPIQIPH